MRAFLHYLLAYLRSTSRPALIITTLFVAALITTNYTFGIERHILAAGPWYVAFAGFFLFYGIVIAAVWGLQYEWGGGARSVMSASPPPRFFQPRLVILLLLAPLFFAAKMVHWDLSPLLPSGYPSNH